MTLRLFETFQAASFADTVVSYLAAFAFGTLIGAERQYRQRTAGLRTNALVAIGASAFVDLGRRLGGDVESIRVIAYVVSGIGFLGAGVIMKEGTNVRGLNTAATLWCSAAVGAIAGSDLLAEAALLTACVLGANTILRPLVDVINRIPVAGRVLEASYTVTIVGQGHAGALADMLEERLAEAKLPVAEITTREQAGGKVEIDAHLMVTNVDSDELDQFVDALGANDTVLYATWRSAARD
ncbi:MgtC/SapB family protein [Novosphingobium sp. FKTRR1]|uniref:MgtC/SapB family protein n=1 Tax=unclassified Novosphingobium TaxID=2644732 RepID=UPI001CF0AF05|nr:MgtC/SapB family protein [Novosphingobium sp. FKTRR1]